MCCPNRTSCLAAVGTPARDSFTLEAYHSKVRINRTKTGSCNHAGGIRFFGSFQGPAWVHTSMIQYKPILDPETLQKPVAVVLCGVKALSVFKDCSFYFC
ncbi:hypothetical protein ATANTOWER_000005 [Ataeniobius toweri]|uniref:Uncharacterized protein n=1 Tax=Ataeniobius toweri TaxID=208326 RepID=A0ABU7CDQ4_9TELE|nr:hypothetical protein [Ataeniobius toweri]